MSFLCDFSDRIESSSLSALALGVERNAAKVVGLAWDCQLDDQLVGNVQRFRTYDPSSVRDLLRLIRNKHHHFDELPNDLKSTMVSNTGGLVRYFEVRFPRLLIHCFSACRSLLPMDDLLLEKYGIRSIREEIKQVDPAVPMFSQPGCDFAEQWPKAEVTNAVNDRLLEESDHSKVDSPSEKSSLQANLYVREEDGLNDHVSPPINEISLSVVGPDLNGVSLKVESDELVIWEGSTSARTFNCRGWSRSDEEWERRMDAKLLSHRNKRDDSILLRCAEDPKYRTRLCNYWDASSGMSCPMLKKGKCIFAHGPVELRVKEGKRHRWGKLVDKCGDSSNPHHSGGEDTYGVARAIEKERKHEGKWGSSKIHSAQARKKPGKKAPKPGQ
jgi:hypothetical protein